MNENDELGFERVKIKVGGNCRERDPLLFSSC